MSREQLLGTIKECVENVLGSEVEIAEETHLVNDDVLDSLDSATFIFEIEAKTNKKLPEGDIDEAKLYLVSNLIDYLSKE